MTTRAKGITLPIYFYYSTDITGLSVTPTSGDYTSQSAWKYGPGIISPVTLVNTFLTTPIAANLKAQSANPSFAALGGDIKLNPGVGSVGNASGNVVIQDNAGAGSAWNTSHLVLGTYHLWVDAKTRLRYKLTAPTSDIDGIPVGNTYQASVVYDPPSILAGASATTTIGVAGAILGDLVTGVSFSLDQQGIMFSGYVSAPNVVTVVLFNRTAGTLDLLSGTLRVSVLAGT